MKTPQPVLPLGHNHQCSFRGEQESKRRSGTPYLGAATPLHPLPPHSGLFRKWFGNINGPQNTLLF